MTFKRFYVRFVESSIWFSLSHAATLGRDGPLFRALSDREKAIAGLEPLWLAQTHSVVIRCSVTVIKSKQTTILDYEKKIRKEVDKFSFLFLI